MRVDNLARPILRLQRESARDRQRYAGDGGQSEKGGADIWDVDAYALHARRGFEEFEIFWCFLICGAVVQLCQPQSGRLISF